MPPTQQTIQVEVIKQYPGAVTAERRVKVKAPGKFFNNLTPTEQAAFYDVQASEFKERHDFKKHSKAWGAAHRGPGIRFICGSDAVEDPDNKGFWVTLLLWNRWRHETYKNDREAEKQYMDELPSTVTATPEKAKAEKSPPAVKQHFTLVCQCPHTYGGTGPLAGKTVMAFLFACNKPGCPRGTVKPVKQVGSGTGQLFVHLESCQPQLALQLRAQSQHSPVMMDEQGRVYSLYSFAELLPHHILYVQKCFRGFDHFDEARANRGLIEWVRSFDERAAIPCAQTCGKIMDIYELLMDRRIASIIKAVETMLGLPHCSEQSDLWSLKSCRATFGCIRGSWTLDGDMLAELLAMPEYRGRVVSMSPILAFEEFEECRHSGAVLARWKTRVHNDWHLVGAVKLATEDGASNNKKAAAIMGQPMKVCLPHDVARAVLHAAGEEGKPSKNTALKLFTARASGQAAAFSRSVVNSSRLHDAQVDNGTLAHQTLTTKVKNKTRWLGLWDMANRNRRIGTAIPMALTGNANGVCAEPRATQMPTRQPAVDSDSDEDSDSGDEHEDSDQEEANRAASKEFPMAHRCLDRNERNNNDIFESVLDRPREVTLLSQDNKVGFVEGLDLAEAFCTLQSMRDEARADRIQLISGPGDGVWTETSALQLPEMFQTFRKIFADHLTTRFALDTTPDVATLLALKMHPVVNTDPDGPQLEGKSAKAEMMQGEYVRALRRQMILMLASPPPAAPAVPDSSPAAPDADVPMPAVELGHEKPPTPTEPAGKRRRGLMGMMATTQIKQDAVEQSPEEKSPVDLAVAKEIDLFESISKQVQSEGEKSQYYEGGERFNLGCFWAAHKKTLPAHYRVYIAEVGPCKAAAANVETVFSGVGKFTQEARSAGGKLIRQMARLHHNWDYEFLRPTDKEVFECYKEMHPNAFTFSAASSSAASFSS